MPQARIRGSTAWPPSPPGWRSNSLPRPRCGHAIIGVYLVALGLIGLRRFHLVRALEDRAAYIEAAGAATIMTPSGLRALEDEEAFLYVVLAEAVAFFTLSVGLRRQALLATSTLFLALIAGRALFFAIRGAHIGVVLGLAGVALLAIGFGILLGRERWSAWQDRVAHWWGEEEPPPA